MKSVNDKFEPFVNMYELNPSSEFSTPPHLQYLLYPLTVENWPTLCGPFRRKYTGTTRVLLFTTGNITQVIGFQRRIPKIDATVKQESSPSPFGHTQDEKVKAELIQDVQVKQEADASSSFSHKASARGGKISTKRRSSRRDDVKKYYCKKQKKS